MEILKLVFHLGVLFATYSFLWFFIELILQLLRGGQPKKLPETYIINSVKYLFLVNVTFLFCLENETENLTLANSMPSLIVLAVYFIGKFQRRQEQFLFSQSLPKELVNSQFNLTAEIVLTVASVIFFIVLIFYPEIAHNNIANWFKASIEDLGSTVIIGFVLKIVGFFFLLSLILKTLNGIIYLISGKPLVEVKTRFGKKNDSDDSFDDFEEIK
ncbi:MAG: hypothetical protein RL264_366 [Bacteroidota bacterium]|jgi:hypothetical protein